MSDEDTCPCCGSEFVTDMAQDIEVVEESHAATN